MKRMMLAAAVSLWATNAFAQVSVDEVHEAILTYRCQCEQSAFADMSEDAQSFVRYCGAMPDDVLRDEIEAKRGMEKWSAMLVDFMGFEIATLSSCSEDELRAQLKKQFPKSKDATSIEKALTSEPDESRLFFWNMRNEGCDFVRGFARLMRYKEAYPQDFEVDLDLGGDGN